MTRDEILAAFDRIRVWQQGDRRAVHKPLLVLLALGRLLRGEAPLVEFASIEEKLGKLLEEFGPSGSEKTRHNPFWHLRTDGVWQLEGPAGITDRPAGATPTITELRQGRLVGPGAGLLQHHVPCGRGALAPTTLRNCDDRSARGRASYNAMSLVGGAPSPRQHCAIATAGRPGGGPPAPEGSPPGGQQPRPDTLLYSAQ